jgi:hypothetical protein
MNGFADHGLDEGAFGEKGNNIVQAFDAFRKKFSVFSCFFISICRNWATGVLSSFKSSADNLFPAAKSKPQYVTRTSGGGKWTVVMLIVSFLLAFSELSRWWRGYETHTFTVEKGVGQNLQINLDVVVAMKCADIHVNVQDATGDRILAGNVFKKDPTRWKQWTDNTGIHKLGKDAEGRLITGEGFHDEGFGEEHVHDIVNAAKKSKFAKTPKMGRMFGKTPEAEACRIYGSLGMNKVQGDFHITARGHGYQEIGEHLDHSGTAPKSTLFK